MDNGKTLFLDIDGVCNSTRYWRDQGGSLPLGTAGALDPAAVERLNRIVGETNCRVILSSSWRGLARERDLTVVQRMLRARGYRYALAGMTRPMDAEHTDSRRCDEIAAWLRADGTPPRAARYVVLDDGSDAWSNDFPPGGCFVQPDFHDGLLDSDVRRAVLWLNGTEESRRCEASVGPGDAPVATLKRCKHPATTFIPAMFGRGHWVCTRHRRTAGFFGRWVGETDERASWL